MATFFSFSVLLITWQITLWLTPVTCSQEASYKEDLQLLDTIHFSQILRFLDPLGDNE